MAQSIWNSSGASQNDLDEYGQPKKPLGMVGPAGGGYTGALPPGYSQGEVDEWLSRNPGDAHRVTSALTDRTPGHGMPQYTDGGGGSSSSGSGVAAAAPTSFTSGLRDILMTQLGAMGQAPTVNDPGIAENLAGRRLALQRGSERERKNAAEMRAYDGSGGLGGKAFEMDARGILERQSEAEAQGVGDVLGGELQQRRQQLTNLLSMAIQSGDAESARAIQMELAQMQNRFNYAGLGQQQGQFEDSMAFNYAGLNQNANRDALMAMLGAA